MNRSRMSGGESVVWEPRELNDNASTLYRSEISKYREYTELVANLVGYFGQGRSLPKWKWRDGIRYILARMNTTRDEPYACPVPSWITGLPRSRINRWKLTSSSAHTGESTSTHPHIYNKHPHKSFIRISLCLRNTSFPSGLWGRLLVVASFSYDPVGKKIACQCDWCSEKLGGYHLCLFVILVHINCTTTEMWLNKSKYSVSIAESYSWHSQLYFRPWPQLSKPTINHYICEHSPLRLQAPSPSEHSAWILGCHGVNCYLTYQRPVLCSRVADKSGHYPYHTGYIRSRRPWVPQYITNSLLVRPFSFFVPIPILSKTRFYGRGGLVSPCKSKCSSRESTTAVCIIFTSPSTLSCSDVHPRKLKRYILSNKQKIVLYVEP